LFAFNCSEWTEDGKLWVQYVSSTPATRLDVVTLQENLDQRLQHRQARETGICPIREELYAQCFGTTHLLWLNFFNLSSYSVSSFFNSCS
jgi:hypothetical protein